MRKNFFIRILRVVLWCIIFYFAIGYFEYRSGIKDKANFDETNYYQRFGEYKCPDAYVEEARKLMPSQTEKDYLDKEFERLQQVKDSIDKETAELESKRPEPTSSQAVIDSFNESINRNRATVEKYNQGVDLFNNRKDSYNKVISQMDEFLSTNCLK